MKAFHPLFLAIGFTSVVSYAIPALQVDYVNLDYDNLATDIVDCSALLTWTPDGTPVDVQRRKGNEASWTTLATGVDSGTYTDSTVIPSATYHYRLAAGDTSSAEVDFLAVRHLPATGYPLFSDGDFSSQSWCKPYKRAFDGDTSQDSYPDAASPQRPKIGVDFGSATNYIAFVRLMPRYTDGCENRLHHTIIYGTADPDVNGTALTDEADVASVASGSGKQWYTVNTFNSSTAYRCYYFQGANGANVNECAFFGWTEDDLDAASASDLECAVARSDWDNSYAVVTWDASIGTVTLQRRTGYEGTWEDLDDLSTGTYTDETAPFGQTVFYRISTNSGDSPAVSFFRMRRLHTDGYPLFTNGGGESEGWYKPVQNAFDGNVNTFPDMTFSTDARMGVDFGAATNFVAFVRLISRNDTIYRMGGFRVCGSGGNWESEETTLTDVIAYQEGVVLYELDADYSTAYRCYFAYDNDTQSYGNVAEIEFYGWSAADIGQQQSDLFDFAITRSDLTDYYPVLSWNGGFASDVAVERRSAGTVWTTVTTVHPGTSLYTDTSAKPGILYDYRLVCGNNISETLPFRRLRRLGTDGYPLFSNGIFETEAWYRPVEVVFDGHTSTFADMNFPSGEEMRMGVDFGSATNVVALVRICRRNDGNAPNHVNGYHICGCDDSESTGTAITDPVAYDSEANPLWYEIDADYSKAYRCYYASGANWTKGNIAEVELYGWWTTDIPDLCTVILFR